MKITLIGMASVGKSYWSQKFEDVGFLHFDLDDLIRQRLMKHLNLPLNTTALMNEWLNFPDSPGFAEREQLFVDLEAEVFHETLLLLEQADEHTTVIVDTGGSLVYSPKAYWKRLKELTTIIYLKTDKLLSKSLLNNYLQEGRSMIWRDVYRPLSEETRHETYTRCYNDLVHFRESCYVQYADCEVEYQQHRHPNMLIKDFLCLYRPKNTEGVQNLTF
jgi:shikimate kinase